MTFPPVKATDVDEDIVLEALTDRQVASASGKAHDTSESGEVSGPSIPSDSSQRDVPDPTIPQVKLAAHPTETPPASGHGRPNGSHRLSLHSIFTRSLATASPFRPGKLRSVS